eukprot:scaffold48065_cov19-Tisochrysis_lutea.AAC.2
MSLHREVRAQLSQAEAQAASHAEGLAKAQADLEAACAGREAAQQEAAAAKAGAEAAAAAVEETAGLKSQLAQVCVCVRALRGSFQKKGSTTLPLYQRTCRIWLQRCLCASFLRHLAPFLRSSEAGMRCGRVLAALLGTASMGKGWHQK